MVIVSPSATATTRPSRARAGEVSSSRIKGDRTSGGKKMGEKCSQCGKEQTLFSGVVLTKYKGGNYLDARRRVEA